MTIDPTLPFASTTSNTKLEQDIEPMYTAWKANQTPETRGGLLKATQPIIHTAIQSYGGGQAASSVLKSRARLMALRAFDSYDPARGSMKNHLLGHLQGLRRVSAQQQQIISLPEQVGLDRKHLMSAENVLRDQLGRDPSDAEIADHTGLSLKRLGYIRQVRPVVASGSVLGNDTEGDNDFTPASTIPGQQTGDDAWAGFIYHDLGPIDKAIMDYTLGLRGTPKLPVQQIALRLGITAGAVSQRTTKIQQMLDEGQGFFGQ